MLIGKSLHWSEYRTPFQLRPGNSSRAWITTLFYVDKQKPQGLKALLSLSHSLTKTHTHPHTHKATVWSAVVKLEPTGLSAGCVIGGAPRQVIRLSPQRTLMGELFCLWHCWMHLQHRQPSDAAGQLERTAVPAVWRTPCASTLNFLPWFCEAATSPVSKGGNTRNAMTGSITSLPTLDPCVSWRMCQCLLPDTVDGMEIRTRWLAERRNLTCRKNI